MYSVQIIVVKLHFTNEFDYSWPLVVIKTDGQNPQVSWTNSEYLSSSRRSAI